jgi:hypothetical protein
VFAGPRAFYLIGSETGDKEKEAQQFGALVQDQLVVIRAE